MALTENPYGVTIGLNPGSPPASNYAFWSLLFADMAALRLTWLRFQLSWNLIQLNQSDPPSVWSWGPLDDAVSHANAQGIPIVFPLRGAPTWALQTASQKASTEPWYLPDPTMMASFAQAVALRYNGQNGHGFLDAIEVGNEDFNIHFTPSGQGYVGLHNSPYTEYNGLSGVSANVQPTRDPYFYLPVLQQAAPLIRAASPGTKVGLGAIWWRQHPNTADFVDAIYAGITNAQTYFDYLNFHFYSNAADPLTDGSGTPNYVPSFRQVWSDIQGRLNAHGDANKPVWCTEFGWQVPQDTNATTQASRYQAVLDNARTSGVVTKMFLFTLDYKTAGFSSSSLVQYGYSTPGQYGQLPAYSTVQNYTAQYPLWTPPSVSMSTQARDGQAGTVKARDGLTATLSRGAPQF